MLNHTEFEAWSSSSNVIENRLIFPQLYTYPEAAGALILFPLTWSTVAGSYPGADNTEIQASGSFTEQS